MPVSLNRDAIKSSLSRLTAPRSPGRQRSKSKTTDKEVVHDDEQHHQQLQQQPPAPATTGYTQNPEFDDDDYDDVFPNIDEEKGDQQTMPPLPSSSRDVVSGRRQQQQRGGDPPSSSAVGTSFSSSSSNENNSTNTNTTETKLQAIKKVYGPNTNIYRDVLKVSPTASPAEIREAFFCLRYDLYQKHDDQGGGAGLTNDERKAVEQKMDAIAGAFHILGDVNRRRAYDASLLPADAAGFEGGARRSEVTDEMGFPITPNRGSPASAAILPTTTSASPNVSSTTRNLTPQKLPPTRQLSPRQRRTINHHRERAAATSSGMNESRRVVARPVTGGLNARPSPAASSTVNAEDGIGGGKKIEGRESPHWAEFDSTPEMMMVTNPPDATHRSSPEEDEENVNNEDTEDDNEVPIMGGVNNLNAREQLLQKSQMKYSQQRQQSRTATGSSTTASSSLFSSRLANRYNNDRGDRYATDNPEVQAKKNSAGTAGLVQKPSQLASPTGVEADLDRDSNDVWSRKFGGRRGADSGRSGTDSTNDDDYQATTPRTATTNIMNRNDNIHNDRSNDSNNYDDDEGEESTFASSYDEDTRTYDDDTQTYDDDTQTYDDTTIGGSTWASADTSYIQPDPPRHSPGHKKGNMPEPILKSGFNRGEKRGQESEKRRVTIHSHRGRGEDEEDFSLFDGAMCPNLLSLGAIREEVNGTYNDFTQALHQVTNAFVINPDDIDRLADKIRDAKIELGENYARQVNERRIGGSGSSGKEVARAGGGGGGTTGKKKSAKKASTKSMNADF
ncbi:hypothetical protein ACHAWU_010397 [Discostella pseudostelligera]|uniref:J domain-containing protein n=1 Tax=Discostella pseudostelligera TaxID=259834 RepID=A0ABD3MQT0_9STRA